MILKLNDCGLCYILLIKFLFIRFLKHVPQACAPPLVKETREITDDFKSSGVVIFRTQFVGGDCKLENNIQPPRYARLRVIMMDLE